MGSHGTRQLSEEITALQVAAKFADRIRARDTHRRLRDLGWCLTPLAPAVDQETAVTEPTVDATDGVEGWCQLRCGFCGHWDRGRFTKDRIAGWLRAHRNASISPNPDHLVSASTCPHPCGTSYIGGGTSAPDDANARLHVPAPGAGGEAP